MQKDVGNVDMAYYDIGIAKGTAVECRYSWSQWKSRNMDGDPAETQS